MFQSYRIFLAIDTENVKISMEKRKKHLDKESDGDAHQFLHNDANRMTSIVDDCALKFSCFL